MVVRSVQGIFCLTLLTCFFVSRSISKYPSFVPTTNFSGVNSIQVILLFSRISEISLVLGEKVLIDNSPKIQNRLVSASYLISRTLSLESMPSHKLSESCNRVKFLPSEIKNVKSSPPQKIFASGILWREYKLPAHALLKTALSSI